MADGNGVSRREFDDLSERVRNIERYGSPGIIGLREALQGERERRREEDDALDRRVSRMERAQTAFATGLGTLITGVIVGVIVYLVTHAG